MNALPLRITQPCDGPRPFRVLNMSNESSHAHSSRAIIYRPCPAPEVIQAKKMASSNVSENTLSRPSAPTVYQPCPAREVIQARLRQHLGAPSELAQTSPRIPPAPRATQRSAVLQRVVSRVQLASGQTYKFFAGVGAEDAHEDKANCYDATTKGNVTGLGHFTAHKAWEHLRGLAGQMAGKSGAYCAQGRERSAIAVFAALYINHGILRDTARDMVISAIRAAGGVYSQTEVALDLLVLSQLPKNANQVPSSGASSSGSSSGSPSTSYPRSPVTDARTVEEGRAWIGELPEFRPSYPPDRYDPMY